MPINVLYQDDRLIVLDKPPGLLSVPGIGPEKRDCLAARVQAEHPAARIVHRLDRDTSGVIVMALDAEAHRDLSIQFQNRRVLKRYTAVALGRVADDAGQIDLPIRKDMDDPPRQMIDPEQGRWAVTDYFVVERFTDRTWLDLRPTTGRSHQLRLHLRHIGHPILGDDLYGHPEAVTLADRLLLHAAALTLTHPATGERMAFESPCPF